MTVSAIDGPWVTIGTEAALGSATATVGITGAPAGYVTGSGNPDAGPNCFFAGNLFKDMRYRYLEGGGANAPGYPNQAVGFVDHLMQTVSLVPSAISTTNIAAAQAPTANTAMTLAAGTGITLTTTAITILATGNIVPAGVYQIDAAPSWVSYGDSGAMRGWAGDACGRCISLTSGGNASAVHFLVTGYDIYGVPMTQLITGPSGNTVNSLKGFKWIASIVPDATSVQTVSVGTADILEFPIRADRFSQVNIWWDETLVTANTGFVAAVTTSPSTNLLGDVRGTYALQSASDGTKRLTITQRIAPSNINTTTGVFGVSQV